MQVLMTIQFEIERFMGLAKKQFQQFSLSKKDFNKFFKNSLIKFFRHFSRQIQSVHPHALQIHNAHGCQPLNHACIQMWTNYKLTK